MKAFVVKGSKPLSFVEDLDYFGGESLSRFFSGRLG